MQKDPISNTPTTNNLNQISLQKREETPKPTSKAARAANLIYDQANDVSNLHTQHQSGELSPGEAIQIGPLGPPPQISQSHDFGPLAPPINGPLLENEDSKPTNPLELHENYESVNSPLSQSSGRTHNPPHSRAQKIEKDSRLGRIARKLKLKKLFTKRNTAYVGIAMASFLTFYLILNFQTILLQINYAFKKPQVEPAISIPEATKLVKAPEPQAVPPGNVIIIPKINVNAPVVFEPSLEEEKVQFALRSGVVHYANTGIFGKPGNAVIVGHSSLDPWSPGKYKFVFALLEKVGVGDQIQVNYEQKKYVYQVYETKIVPPTDVSVLNQTEEPTLTLITCTPAGTNWRRFIVHAKQVEPLNRPQIAEVPAPAEKPAHNVDLPGKAPLFMDKVRQFFKNIFG